MLASSTTFGALGGIHQVKTGHNLWNRLAPA
jgi:hypothetical protein